MKMQNVFMIAMARYSDQVMVLTTWPTGPQKFVVRSGHRQWFDEGEAQGSGHYFSTLEEAYAFFIKRLEESIESYGTQTRWISDSMEHHGMGRIPLGTRGA